MSDSDSPNFAFGASLEGQTLQGHYVIEKMIARGGMAWLFKARHKILQEAMAVKLLYPHLSENPKVRARFVDEAKIQFRLKHPHIVQVTDVVQDRGLIGSVMEWVDGEDLKNYLVRRGEPLSIQEIWDILQPILDALHYAHGLGLIHRDIKPANILLHWEGYRMTPKLSDFGIAKVLNASGGGERTSTGATLGTMEYMAPEQIQDSKRVDVRADVYSLGVSLYYMATGTLPFTGGTEVLLYKQLYEEPASPKSLVPSLSQGLNELILRCMQKSPSLRFQNCMELSYALSSLLSKNTQDGIPFTSTLDMPIFDNNISKSAQAKRSVPPLPTGEQMGSEVLLPTETSAQEEPSPLVPNSSLLPLQSKTFDSVAQEEAISSSVTFHPEDRVDDSAVSSRRYLWGSAFLFVLIVGLVAVFLLSGKNKKNKLSGLRTASTSRPVSKVEKPVASKCVEGHRRTCYTGPSGTLGKGECKSGFQVCKNGSYGSCRGDVKPAKLELCNNRDDNCDGQVDESFPTKGSSCTQRIGACTYRGVWACHSNQKQLRCQRSGQLLNRRAAPVRIQLRPKRQRFVLKFGSRRVRARAFTCLEIKAKTFLSIEARGYQLCAFSLSARRQTLRLKLKRNAALELPTGYCLSR